MKLLFYILLFIPIIGYSQYPHTPNFDVRTTSIQMYFNDTLVDNTSNKAIITNGINPIGSWSNQCVLVYLSDVNTPDIVLPISDPMYFNDSVIAGYQSYYYQLNESRESYTLNGECAFFWNNNTKVFVLQYNELELYLIP